MGKRVSLGFAARLLRAAGATRPAVAAGLLVPASLLGLWWLASAMPAAFPTVLTLIVTPLLAGAAGWLVARAVVRTSLLPAIEQIERFAMQDFSTQAAFGRGASRELAGALEACRLTLAAVHHAHQMEQKAWLAKTDERGRADAAARSAARIHAAVARLMGAAINRLSNGDLTARINLDLPLHYAPVRADFNAAMVRLEEAFDRAGATGQRLENCGREIEDASAVLMRRAGKLAERLDEELATIHSGGYQQDPEKALRRLLYTMNGVQIATQRNAQAAACFGKLGRLVTKEAERLQSVTRAFRDLDGDASGQAAAALPAAAVPASIGALALKLEPQPAE